MFLTPSEIDPVLVIIFVLLAPLNLSALVSPSTEIDPLLKEYVFVPAAMLAKRLVAAISTPE